MMKNRTTNIIGTKSWAVLIGIFVAVSLSLKLSVIDSGAPYVTIDDQTMYEGGFLIWFGQAPPQRTLLESWLSGTTSILTYSVDQLMRGESVGIDLITEAYRDFYQNPDKYVYAYRLVAICIDLLTAALVFLFAKSVFRARQNANFLAALTAGLYLLSYNTIWSSVVARPDIPMVMFSTLGLFLYLESDRGKNRAMYLWSALAFGIAAGLKLHAAFFVPIVILDQLRLNGLRSTQKSTPLFGGVAVIAFLVSAGTPLYDPLLYAKLRMLNAIDDISPWLTWGDQFITILAGTGWIVLPISVIGAILFFREHGIRSSKRISSVFFLCLCWFILFATIRQLRGYWMLPALPLAYCSAVYALSMLRIRALSTAAYVASISLLLSQSVLQAREFRETPYDQLSHWFRALPDKSTPVYILGFEAVGLPLSGHARVDRQAILREKLEASRRAGDSFTVRHIINWEERSHLLLLDMLDGAEIDGFNYIGFHNSPSIPGKTALDLSNFDYVLLQEYFQLDGAEDSESLLSHHFTHTDTITGPGGGGRGLKYKVFIRKTESQ